MINELKAIRLKFTKTLLTYVPLCITICFIILMNFYLGRDWNLDQVSQYVAAYNAITALLLSILVYQVITFEEAIGHFNHILRKPKRYLWVNSSLIYIYSNYLLGLLLTTINLLWMYTNFKIAIIYFFSSFIFNVIILILLFITGIFVNSVINIALGIFLTIFNIYFGIEVLGDNSWFYIPITYSTRYTSMLISNTLPFVVTVIIYAISTILLFSCLHFLFRNWEGRNVTD
ncbi:BsaG family lantibiotic immunity ABC transporter permease subunit [Staphylococcus felis]|uniref:BsaG family lantibiotic immunity ABC transporter permease subunit n=1 Tax=Staphylococcus felis TaxID=46127 RepID=UPI001EE8796F|nr:BsaG protein [Staphylococcus felis]